MSKLPTAEKLANALFWNPIRQTLITLLGRSASKVLLVRELRFNDGTQKRWLKPEFVQYRKVLRGAAKELQECAHLKELPTIGNRLMVELAILTIAAYRALLRCGVEPAEARRAVADIGWGVYASLLGLASLPFRIISRNPGFRVRNTIRFLLWFPFNTPGRPGYEAKVWVENENIYTHFTHCPPQTFVRQLIADGDDKGDLEAFRASWCRYDWPGADVIAADGRREHYDRQHTLSHGDSVCDMCWAARSLKQRTTPSVS